MSCSMSTSLAENGAFSQMWHQIMKVYHAGHEKQDK